MLRRISLVTLSIVLIASIVVRSQVFTISFGPLVTTLSTASTGAVTGNTYALPGGNASVLSWQSTANGSALSTVLQASIDNSSWTTIASCAVAAGCLSSTGVIGYPFVRTNQVSRTGGTLTTNTIVAVRAYSAAAIGATATLQGNLLFTPDNTWTIGNAATLRPSNINAAGNMTVGAAGSYNWNGRTKLTSASDGTILIQNAAGTDFTFMQLGGTTNAFPMWKRSGTQLHARLADDSAYSGIVGSNIVPQTSILFATPITFGTLPADSNGSIRYCSDCLANSNPCSGVSTGAMAKRLNGIWDCR